MKDVMMLGMIAMMMAMGACSMFDKNTVKDAKCQYSETTETVVVTCTAPKVPVAPLSPQTK